MIDSQNNWQSRIWVLDSVGSTKEEIFRLIDDENDVSCSVTIVIRCKSCADQQKRVISVMFSILELVQWWTLPVRRISSTCCLSPSTSKLSRSRWKLMFVKMCFLLWWCCCLMLTVFSPSSSLQCVNMQISACSVLPSINVQWPSWRQSKSSSPLTDELTITEVRKQEIIL